MKEEQIDQLVKEFYDSVEMSESKMAHILKKAQEDKVVPFYKNTWFSYAAAACIAFLIVSVVVSRTVRSNPDTQTTQFASKLINVYDRNYSPDVYTADWDSIHLGLDHQGFSVIPTNLDNLKRYSVVGARNCRSYGVKAVHVVLFNENSKKESCLYVLPDEGEFKKLKDSMVKVGDQRVSMWHDNGRFFALYEPK